MNNSPVPFEQLFKGITLYRFRRIFRFLPIILVISAGLYIYRNEGELTEKGVLILVLAILSCFYKRSSFYLIMAMYVIWYGVKAVLNFNLNRAFFIIGSAVVSVLLIFLFIRFQYLEQKEIQMPFVSKKVISNSEHIHKIESQLAFYLGIFSFISFFGAFVVSRNIISLGVVVEASVYNFLNYILDYTTFISLSLGLAGWIGDYSKKILSIIGCIASLLVIVASIYLYIQKI